MTEPAIRTLGLGAGIQSTTLIVLSIEGALPKLDAAIFADTGWEPRHVYDHLDRVAAYAAQHGVPVIKVRNGNLRTDLLSAGERYASIPYFIRNPDGGEGIGRRQCTSNYKLTPVNRKIRELLGAKAPDYRRVPRGQVAEHWIGFSTDEIGRVSNHDQVSYIDLHHPLLDLGMSRTDCERFLRARGWTVAKSACIGCPFHGNRQWRALRDTCDCSHPRADHPEPDATALALLGGQGVRACSHPGCPCMDFNSREWADAVEFDAAIRKGGARGLPLAGEAFLHRSRVPLELAPIDRVTSAEWKDRQGSIFDAIADTELEAGDPDGCSPYGCRSGSAL